MNNNYEGIRYHLDYFYELTKDLKAKRILEIGVCDGNSTRAFIRAAKEIGAEVISIDIADCSKVTDYSKWIFIQADSAKVKIKAPIDILFIDSSHYYKETLYELENYSPLVVYGGVVLLHDVIDEWISVKKIKRVGWKVFNPFKIIRYLLTPRIGVKKAIIEFLRRHPEWNYVERVPEGDLGGLGILKREVERTQKEL